MPFSTIVAPRTSGSAMNRIGPAGVKTRTVTTGSSVDDVEHDVLDRPQGYMMGQWPTEYK
jgi:hypothetical protein